MQKREGDVTFLSHSAAEGDTAEVKRWFIYGKSLIHCGCSSSSTPTPLLAKRPAGEEDWVSAAGWVQFLSRVGSKTELPMHCEPFPGGSTFLPHSPPWTPTPRGVTGSCGLKQEKPLKNFSTYHDSFLVIYLRQSSVPSKLVWISSIICHL